MTRIIGGTAGGRRLQTPRGEATRPTSDRVREALFSAIESAVGSLKGMRFLDLYAGSGAVGLEAWSRGAAAVMLVERDRRTASSVRANAASIGCEVAEVVTGAVATVLARGPTDPRHRCDVVFLDPPYPLPNAEAEQSLALLVEHGWLSPDAVVVLERSSRSASPQWPEGLLATRDKRYGETVLHYARSDDQYADPAEDRLGR